MSSATTKDGAFIRKLLIANRGEIACRVIRTAREMGIATVAVFSDADAGAPHVRAADEAVRLPGFSSANTYLRADLILAAAHATGSDAIHPGYGFLSENAAFARACGDDDILFIGPPPDVIEAMGSKVGAKQLMAEAGVPILPGFTVEPSATDTELFAAAREITYPVLVKASAGGGGRGMRVVIGDGDLIEAVAGAQREAAAAFGDGLVFIERYVDAPRHIEVQIFGDHHGTVVSLFERECSIQRRYQKIVEEAPSPAITPEQRASLCATAVAAGRSIGYVGAGTVEFVMDPDGSFFFLEVNTRLQVEHPVTELITGLDLVRLQIEVAQGAPLPAAVIDATITGHAIEARLYAEDVPAGFVPSSGPVHRLSIPDGVRVDSGYVDGSTVSTFYDAMLAKVISWAPTRLEAASRLAGVLQRAEIHGVVTNRDLLVATLRHPDFESGRTDTAFYERNRQLMSEAVPASVHRIHAIAAALAPIEDLVGGSGRRSPQPSGVPRGWRNVGVARIWREFRRGEESIVVVIEHCRASVSVATDGDAAVPVTVIVADPESVEFEMLGAQYRVRLHRVENHLLGPAHVYADSANGTSDFVVVPRFVSPEPRAVAGSLVSPMPGSVVEVRAAVGDEVAAGQVIISIEAMKMEHAIRSPIDGVVAELRVRVGDQVTTGAVLAVVVDAAAPGHGLPSSIPRITMTE